jgi:hypothetical protein
MIHIPVIAHIDSKELEHLSTQLISELNLIQVETTDEFILKVISLPVCIGVIDWNRIQPNYIGLLPDLLNSLSDVRILIKDEDQKSNAALFNKATTEVLSGVPSRQLAEHINKLYLEVAAEPVKESIIDNIDSLFGELSQCLLQINKDSRFPKLQSLLGELDRLYLEAKPLLDGFHHIQNEHDRAVKLPFPINEIVRFYINRYQRLSSGRLVFTMDSNLKFTENIIGPYLGLSNILELLFCYSLAHTEYGFIGINIEYKEPELLEVTFSDTGDEHPHSITYRNGLEKSYELLASYLIRQLGGNLIVSTSELSGFDIKLTMNCKLVESLPVYGKTNKNNDLFSYSLSPVIDMTEQELQTNYRLLLKEVYDLLKHDYVTENAMEWRKLLHKAWPSVAMMGEKTLTDKLKTLHGLLKKEPTSEVIHSYREQIVAELNNYFY